VSTYRKRPQAFHAVSLRVRQLRNGGADFAFEKSEVEAVITSSVISIKNPLSGTISVVSAGEVIIDEPWAKGKVTVSN